MDVNIDVVPVFLMFLWTYFLPFSSVYVVKFEQVNVCWEYTNIDKVKIFHALGTW